MRASRPCARPVSLRWIAFCALTVSHASASSSAGQGGPIASGEVAAGFHAPGIRGEVHASVVFDDGTGPALYIAGDFYGVGPEPAHNLARWDGQGWEGVGSPDQRRIRALAVYDDGAGPRLYAGGAAAPGRTQHDLMRWDGGTWEPVADVTGSIASLGVLDDQLVVGGAYSQLEGQPLAWVSRWDGVTWSAMGSELQGSVQALATLELPTGSELYAAGTFQVGYEYESLARWTGTDWMFVSVSGAVYDLLAWDSGTKTELVVGGDFAGVEGVAAADIASFDGVTWAPLGSGTGASWNGGNGRVNTLSAFVQPSGVPGLVAGGAFDTLNGEPADYLAAWTGSRWADLDARFDRWVDHVAGWSSVQGSTSDVFAFGDFTQAEGLPIVGGARHDGVRWLALSRGAGLSENVQALEVWDDGHGERLYAGGDFEHAGLQPISTLAAWDGRAWSEVGGTLKGNVNKLRVFDDGSGEVLWAGGGISVDGVSLGGVAIWDGTSWTAPGAVGGSSSVNGSVWEIEVYDSGSGPEVYVAGLFSMAGGVAANNVARWDGLSWRSVGGGLGNYVLDLAVHDDGSGPALYACGDFTTAGHGLPVDGLARWNGEAWSPVSGPPVGSKHAMLNLSKGASEELLVAGWFDFGGSHHIVAGLRDGVWVPWGGQAYGQTAIRLEAGPGGSVFASSYVGSGGALLRCTDAGWSTVVCLDWAPFALEATEDRVHMGGSFEVVDGVPVGAYAQWLIGE